jgi:hypothetical protein
MKNFKHLLNNINPFRAKSMRGIEKADLPLLKTNANGNIFFGRISEENASQYQGKGFGKKYTDNK